MTYQELKDVVNELTPEQLLQEVWLNQTDSTSIKVDCIHITEKDEYFDHEDSLGTLDEIKKEYPDEWEDVVSDATLCPKGTVILLEA